MTKVKYCGITRPEDIDSAVRLGVDALGFVLYDKSPRAVTVDKACALTAHVPAFMNIVALVVNMPEDELIRMAGRLPFDIIQFHGDETAVDCARMASMVNKRWMQAIRVQPSDTAQRLLDKLTTLKQLGASAALLDAYHPDKFGGTGDVFDWDKIPKNPPLPIILAGGLTADNIADAIAQTGVYGVDVSGGIEAAKGIKCADKMAAFMLAVRG